FTWEKPDGSRESINVPGRYDVPAGTTMVLFTQLPSDFSATSLAIRSSLQDIRFYIDGVLRVEYSTGGTRLSGKTSASRYVFCPTSAADAGKKLRIELTTLAHQYSGVVNDIYCGDKANIWHTIFDRYELETFIAFFILFAGLATILFSFALGVVYKTSFDMEYLGWCMFMGATWMLGESKLRQIFVSNASSLGALCFVMIQLVPVPILFYADSIQHRQHHRLYTYLGGIAVPNFTVSALLLITGTADYIETLPAGLFILAAVLLTIFINLVKYMHASKSKADRLLLLGLLLAILCVLIESVSVYYVVLISGLFVSAGMLILFFVNIIRTIKNVQNMEQQRREAEILRSRQQTEDMYLQMIQTLAATVEAKDAYTRGHSLRVAEYAAQLAGELGWTDTDINNLKKAVTLHDIGKIGIPDQIWNKPTKLTDDEYVLVRKHTVIGAEILHDIKWIDHLSEIVRSHHERYDGSGYPDGLVGEGIPIHARIAAIADSYDAMNTRHLYRNSMSPEAIREEFLKNRGRQFDPELTDLFLRLMDEHRLNSPTAPLTATDTSELSAVDSTIGKFISDVMSTMKSQEDAASYDFLTRLPMRHLGERLVAEFMQEHSGYLVFIDMDNLKKINDLYGHKAGDRALKLLGGLLADYHEAAVACRLGGDEFLLFVPEISREQISRQIRELFARFRQLTADDVEVNCASLSAGLCMCTKGDSFEECYSKADKALYYVKQNGKNQFFFYQQINRRDLAAGTGRDLALVAKSLHDTGSYIGALDLNYRDFARQYEYMLQLGARSGCRCYLVMVTMDIAVDTLPHIEAIEHSLACMEQAIRHTIRRVDMCTRYSAMQYLIILFEPAEAQIPKVMERVFTQYYQLYDEKSLVPRYEYLAMTS
ncbi:MAG: HD domain-containing phosphohydrolase, partial [Lachnospiraceae bacterium]